MLPSFKIFTTIILCGFFSFCQAQTEWDDVPWTVIGDSANVELGQEAEIRIANEYFQKGEKEKALAMYQSISKKTASITGYIKIKGSQEPVPRASISADLFKYFDYSDQFGKYYLELPRGKYRITVRHIGMKPLYYRLRVVSKGTLDIEMEEGSISLDEVVISSRPIDSNIKESFGGLNKLSIQEVKTLPTLMGEVDILKSLQLMPGVTSVGEGSAGFNVRGGRTDQNLVLLNDVPIFNTSHALGFISAFNQDVVNDFSLYKGNVPANFGGRASSVLEVTTRRGDFNKWKYQGGIGMISSRFTAEGPIKSSKTSLMVAGRASYANWFLQKVADPNVKNSSVSFYDGFATLSHRFSANSTADVTYYTSSDFFQYANQFGYNWDNSVVNAKWRSLSNRKASPVLSLSYGHFKSKLFDPSGFEASQLTNTLNYFQLKEMVNYIPNEHQNVVVGIEGVAYLPKPEVQVGYNGNPNIPAKKVDKNSGIEFSVFANDDYQISKNFSLSVGLRYSQYAHIGPDTVFSYTPGLPKSTSSISDTAYYKKNESIKTFGGLEPRMSFRFNITPKQSFKASYNRMRQYIHMISNTTAPTPIDLWMVANEYLPPQVADNFSFGYFLNLKDNVWETSAEVFYKDMQNLVEYKNFPQLFLNHHIETELLSGRGRAYGAELYVRKLKGKWTGWASYTYSQSEVQVSSPLPTESINNGNWYPSNYNKPHNLSIVINRRLRHAGAFSFIFSYNTGRPMTAIESSYITGGTVVPVYSDRNKYRIPNYVRLDFSFTIGNVFKKIDDSLVFSVYNLLSRENAYSVFYQRPSSTYLIPKAYQLSVLGSALPSLTYNFKF